MQECAPPSLLLKSRLISDNEERGFGRNDLCSLSLDFCKRCVSSLLLPVGGKRCRTLPSSIFFVLRMTLHSSANGPAGSST